MNYTSADIDTLVATVLESAKNRHVSADLIRRLGEQELKNQTNVKAAIKETKNRLHQAAGAYLDSAPNYKRWRSELSAASGEAELRDLSLKWMQAHSSTRERLPILDSFYHTTLASLGPINSVIDIACGLNPLSIQWMGLAESVRYEAYDIYSDMTGFLSEYLQRVGVAGEAHICNCATSPPGHAADLALILKFLPVLEQIEKGSTLEWLKRLNTKAMLISFPTRSLGGKGKGMAQHYEERFLDIVSADNWKIEKFTFGSELCFLIL